MDRLLRHALLASAAVHAVAVAALHRPAPVALPPSLLEVRLTASAAPQPASATTSPAVPENRPPPVRPLPARPSPRGSAPVLAAPAVAPVAPPAAAPEGVAPSATPAVIALAATPAVLEPPRYDAAYLANPPPAYPASARRRGVEGTVTVEARIGPAGDPREIRLASGAGDSALDRAALEAVALWRFVPARRGSEAVEAWVRIPLVFRLD